MNDGKDLRKQLRMKLGLLNRLEVLSESIRHLTRQGLIPQMKAALEKRWSLIRQIEDLQHQIKFQSRSEAPCETFGLDLDHDSLKMRIHGKIQRIQRLGSEIDSILKQEKLSADTRLQRIKSGHNLIRRYVPFQSNAPIRVSRFI